MLKEKIIMTSYLHNGALFHFLNFWQLWHVIAPPN